MILYLDSSALVKRYVAESGSPEVNQWISIALPSATSLVTRAEVAAAICRAAHLGWVEAAESRRALEAFSTEWETLGRLPVLEATVRRAADLACRHNLRGYDAVHLACALLYQDGLGLPVTLATFDRLLWQAGQAEGLALLPEIMP
jgi:predicted nucleic acid-binding protein